ncbi:hypothetical protein CIB48_g9547 [Xylaria polymorpha]|nr:hypothetical protein CIB48_g9547 [Xylaria polymorpha]
MPHHNSHHRSRSHRANTHESRRGRRHRIRVNRFQDAADDSQSLKQDAVGNQTPSWRSPSWDSDATAPPYPDNTSVSNNYDFSSQSTRLELTVRDASDIDETSNSNHYYANSAFEEPAWGETPSTYQPTPYDQAETLTSPESSPEDGVSAAILETAYSSTGPIPLSGYQASQTWAIPAHQNWALERDIPPDRMNRRWSMLVSQGSDAGFSGDATTPSSMTPPGTIEEHGDGSDASGDTILVDHDHFVRGCMGGNDGPWSPYDTLSYQYPS